MNKKLEQMATNRQKKKRLVTRAFAMALFMALFTQFAQAQNVYMHTGSRTLLENETVKFYDSGGESSGPAYYWERWFSRNEDYTFTFKPSGGKKIKATFKQFTAYTDNNGANDAHPFTTHANWSLRLNTAELSIYDGLTTDAENLITTYTGSVINEFSVITDGAMTFHFQSYGYREEGWYAEVELVDDYSVQKPSISFEVCSDDVVLNANNKDATIYYTTDGNDPEVNDPLTGAILYEGPFHVALNTTVKAVAQIEVDGNPVNSSVASLQYTRADETPTPGLATVTREGNTIIMTPAPLVGDINETYEVWYKIGEDGALQQYTEPFEWSTPHTTFYVYTRAQSCSDKMSVAVTLVFDKVQVPDPTITFTVTDENTGEGTVQITCPAGYVLSYTTNGSDPVLNASANSNSVTLNNVAPGTTVKAIAFKVANGAIDDNYKESNIVTLLCLPGGEGQSGAYGDIVILDDREDHSWSYYSDASVDNLHKLDPIDVKITYYGNGQDENNMTTNDAKDIPTEFGAKATGVQVNVNEPGNQFIYLKTLEAANADGSGNYPYTMIANPFQVRPLYNPTKGEDNLMNSNVSSVVRDSNGNIVAQSATIPSPKSPKLPHITSSMESSSQPSSVDKGNRDVTYEKVTSSQSDWSGTYLLVYDYSTTTGYAFSGVTDYYGTYASVTKSNSGNTIASAGSAALLTLAPYSENSSYYTIQINNGNYLYSAYDGFMTGATAANGTYLDDDNTTRNYYCFFNVSYTNGSMYIYCPQWASSGNYYYIKFNTSNNYFIETTSTTNYSFPSFYKQTNDDPGTDCDYSEDFEGVTGTSGYSYAGSLPTGWNYIWDNTTYPAYAPHVYSSSQTSTPGLPSTGNYLGFYASGSTSEYSYAIMPAVAANEAVNHISFKYKFETASYGTLTYGVIDGTDASTYTILGTISNPSPNPGTVDVALNVSQTAGKRIAFRWYKTSTWYTCGIDDICVAVESVTPVSCTVKAVAGSNISTAYVAEGSSFSGTNTSITVNSGSNVTFQATVNSNCAFSGWYNGTQLVSTANPYTCVVSGDLTLTAQAVPTYTVTAAKDDGISTAYVAEGNSFSGTATSVTVAQGGSATFQATVANGYVFDGWYDQSNQRVSANTTYTITNVQGNTTLTAKGTTSYNITVNVTGGGTVTASPNPATAGQTITLTINANSGYNLTNLTVINNATGQEITLSGSGNSRTFTMPASTVTVNAVFVDPTDLYRGFYAWRVKRLSSGLSITDSNNNNYGEGATIYADQEIQFVAEGNSTDNEVEFEALWAKAYVTNSTNTSGLNANVGYERNFMVLSSNPGTNNSTSYLPSQSGNSGYNNGRYVPLYINRGYGYGYSISQQIYTAAEIGASGSITSIGFRVQSSQSSNRTLHIYMSSTSKTAFDYSSDWSAYESETVSASELVYSGTVNFNSTGWKTITLDTPFVYDGSSNIIVTVFDATGTYMSTSPRFFTYSGAAVYNSRNSGAYTETGYYYAMNQSNYKPQIQFTFTTSTVSGLAVPLTMTTRNPDGTGGSTTVTLTNAIECGADLKIENIKMNAISSINANGKNLAIGRGVEAATSGGLCANGVLGLSAASTTSFNLRIESGYYNYLYLMGQYGLTSNGIEKVTLGSDYDRANNKDNSKLRVFNDVVLSEGGSVGTSGTVGDQRCICTVKSGNFDLGTYGEDHQFYMSAENGTMYAGRTLIIEGGLFSDVAGGLDAETSSTNQDKFILRIKGGTFKGAVFGAAQYASAYGNRRFVITGGEFQGWIAGGANGTREDRGDLNGTSAIYVGGKAQVNSNGSTTVMNRAVGGNVFGAGCGYSNTSTSGQVTGGTTVVIADQALVERGVYGGGSYGYTTATANVHVLGGTVNAAVGGVNGTTYSTAIIGGVYGGACQNQGGITNVTMKNGTVNGNIYGGSNALGDISGLATVNVTGGTVNNVFGGGLGTATNMAAGTKVIVSGGTINNNVYGGGALGTTDVNTDITISGGTMVDVYGAGMGNAEDEEYAIVSGQTNVTVSGGTISGSVYGGGAEGNVEASAVASTVNVSGGNIAVDVFGGGKMGTTEGNTFVNVSGGNIRGSVFGGAYGAPNKVYVAGQHSVNIMGGRVFSNVYGGSRNADDALAFTGYSTTETATSSVVNISAGQIDQQVYAAGYYGKTFGSVYVFVGTDAILKAPHKNPSFGTDNENKYKAGNLRIADNIWAGGDWGTFSGGSFGAPTVSGYSDIYVNGEGYNTVTTSESAPTYMNIGGSILGSGTSCDAGTLGRTIMVSNYGEAISSGSKNDNFPEPYTEATRTLYSIQRADTLILDNAHINFVGLAKVNSIEATEKYAIYSFDKTVRIVGGSSLFMNAVTSQIIDFWSASCTNIYAENATYTPVAHDAVSNTPNKIRVNGGNYIEIYHDKMPMTVNGSTVYQAGYGMLNGFAYMMVSENTSENTCAYARPKQCQDTPIENDIDNPNDGGWVSYDSEKNTYDINGNSHNDDTHTLGTLVQMPYENHKNVSSKNGELYFRIWRAGGKYSEREAVINLVADGTNNYGVVAVSVKLPAWKTADSYYMFQSTTSDGSNYNTTIDYGADLKTYNSAYSDATGTTWIHYDNSTNAMASGSLSTALQEIDNMPNVNYGLVTAPGTAMSGNPLIVCGESDAFLAQVTNGEVVNKFRCGDFEHNPEVTFLLTYSNQISTNMSWDPMYITLVQKDENGNEIDIVKIAIIVNTATTIDREFTTQVYAVMNGTGSPHDEYVAKVTLPTFELFDPTAAHASMFNVTNVVFEPVQNVTTQDCWMYKGSTFSADNKFAMEIGGSTNEDNSDGWNGTSTGMKDSKTVTQAANKLLGESSGRTPFAIDFRLTYDGQQTYTENEPFLGTLTFTITYDNVKVPTLVNGQPTYDSETGEQIFHSETKELTIHVQVYRRGTGNAFYLDGQNGSNGYDGRNPDRAALSLSTILNRLGFMAGDIIYVVNTVDVASDLDWIGTRYDHVQIYRYPGNHQLATDDGIIDNDENEAFVGPLVNVKEKGKMTLRDIVLDGHDEEHPCPNPITNSKEDDPIDASVTAESPLATIASGGTLTLTAGAKLQHNTSTNSGGAVVVNDGGTLMMNEDATISNNTILGETNYGGGVYMDGTIIASDEIKIENNKKALADNNLYLTTADKVLTIGTSNSTDDFDGLTEDAHIGVTKTAADDDGWYRVVNVESDSDIEWLAVPYGVRPNDIVYHDGQKFQLEKHTNPLYLYWVGTWVTMQDWNPKYPSADDPNYNPNDMDVSDITSREQLAWLISMVNGSNGATANDFEGDTINIKGDLNMEEYIWVPIGTDQTPFKGTFEGNGNVITGIRTPLVNNDAGLLGYTENATVQDVIVNVNFTGNSINQGAIIGEMNGGTLCNAEAAGTMNGSENTVNMGGLVGLVSNNGKVHSSFAVNDMTATEATTVVGGLVGTNGGNLYNSYANTTMTGVEGTPIGGLVGVNNTGCTVENCYVILGENTFPAFAHTNTGTITICYADKGDNYVSADVTGNVAPTNSGTYGEVLGRNAFGYMYGDNLIAKNTNTYVGNNSVTDEGGLTTYINKHIPVWNGLLSALNQWVRGHQNQGYASWNRATSPDINGDLPILAFPKDNCLGTRNGKFLVYSAFDREDLANHNGLDNLLGTIYNGQSANIYLYDSTRNVVSSTGNNKLFIHEDAALLQAASSKGEIKATVGVTFDNSCKTATDYDGETLEYDWHLMSTPLSNALMGISYNNDENNWWETEDYGQITGVENSYLPDGTSTEDFKHWDFYCYYEPQYHWINFKRSSKNHYHWDEPHDPISYTNESQLTPSKGYMVAIDQDSYLSNVGTLNGPQSNVTIGLTCSGQLPEEDEPTKDWGSNLVGNPYQAYLDLDKVGASTQNGGTGFTKFYVYDADEKTYVPFTLSQSENPVTPSQYIHPHQAFFVLTDADGDFKLTYDMATTKKENGSYFRGKDRVNYPLVNLFVDNEAGNRDLAIIELGRPELGGAEKINALRNANFKVYAHFDGNNYGLLFTPKDAERVPVHFKTREDGTFTMTWSTYNGTFTSLFLVDNMTGTRVNMLQQDHYTFVGNTDDYAARFYLTFAFTDVEEYNYNDGGDFAWFDGSEWIINGEGQLRVVDMTGRVLQSQTLYGGQSRIHLDGYAAGVYVMNLINGNTTKSQKIVIR